MFAIPENWGKLTARERQDARLNEAIQSVAVRGVIPSSGNLGVIART
jgi:hypothetical protein